MPCGVVIAINLVIKEEGSHSYRHRKQQKDKAQVCCFHLGKTVRVFPMSSETTQRTNRKSDRTKKQRIGPDKEKKKKKRRDEDGQVPDDEEERKESSDLFTTVDELTKSLKRRASEAKLDVEKKILFSEKSVRRRSRSMDRLESPREELLESEVEEVLEKLKGQIQLPRKDDGAQTPPKPSSILGNSHNQIPPRSGLSPSASSSNIPSVTTSTVPSSTGHYPKQTQNRPQNSGNSQFSSSLLSPPTSSYFSAEWSSGPAPYDIFLFILLPF
jgi:hypothetical protein